MPATATADIDDPTTLVVDHHESSRTGSSEGTKTSWRPYAISPPQAHVAEPGARAPQYSADRYTQAGRLESPLLLLGSVLARRRHVPALPRAVAPTGGGLRRGQAQDDVRGPRAPTTAKATRILGHCRPFPRRQHARWNPAKPRASMSVPSISTNCFTCGRSVTRGRCVSSDRFSSETHDAARSNSNSTPVCPWKAGTAREPPVRRRRRVRRIARVGRARRSGSRPRLHQLRGRLCGGRDRPNSDSADYRSHGWRTRHARRS
jgi:hypothetical protein